MTFAGSEGINLEDMLSFFSASLLLLDFEENGMMEMYPLKTPIPMAAAGNKRNAVPRGPGPPFLPPGLFDDEKPLLAITAADERCESGRLGMDVMC